MGFCSIKLISVKYINIGEFGEDDTINIKY